jgi:hypothetical protein
VSYLSLATLEPFCPHTKDLLGGITTCPDLDDLQFQPGVGDLCRPRSTYFMPLMTSVVTVTTDPTPYRMTLLTQFANTPASDTVAGMEALASGFPSLKRLDLGPYIFGWFMHGIMPRTGLLMQSLRRLNPSPAIEDMQIRLQWNTGIHGNQFLIHDHFLLNEIPPGQWEHWARGEQEKFVKFFKQEVKASEVAGDGSRSLLERDDVEPELLSVM